MRQTSPYLDWSSLEVTWPKDEDKVPRIIDCGTLNTEEVGYPLADLQDSQEFVDADAALGTKQLRSPRSQALMSSPKRGLATAEDQIDFLEYGKVVNEIPKSPPALFHVEKLEAARKEDMAKLKQPQVKKFFTESSGERDIAQESRVRVSKKRRPRMTRLGRFKSNR